MFAKFAVAVLFLLVPLAGCASESAPAELTGEEEIDKENFQLGANLGAIAGLLVDDRFRPIDLEEGDAAGEFQAAGFILVQETGKQYRTNENGEFNVLDLEPGTYTLRVSAEGHEATPQKVSVTAGAFAETNIVARRTNSDGSTIITNEFSAFTPCSVHVVALSYNLNCLGDQSGDSFRSAVRLDFSSLDTLSWVVLEVKMSQTAENGAAFDAVARQGFDYDYTSAVIFEGDYMKLNMVPGAITPDEIPPGTGVYEWPNEAPFEFIVFGRGTGAEDIRQLYEPVHGVTSTLPDPTGYAGAPMRRGAGAQLGLQGIYMASAFLGEPEVDPQNNYCVLC